MFTYIISKSLKSERTVKRTCFIFILITLLFISITAYAHGPGSGYSMEPWMMWGYGSGWFWPFMLIVPVAIIIGIVFLVKWLMTTPDRHMTAKADESAMDILKKRYARGEIDKEEFEEKRKALDS